MSEVNSLQRMLSVVNLFVEDHPEWTSDEMMAQLGYSRPTLYRYLKALRQNGFLASMNNATFTLGPKVVEMDFLLRRSDPLVLDGKALLDELVSAYPGTAFISRRYRTQVLCIESSHSSRGSIGSYQRGRLMPTARGASSRAILAFLPSRQAESLIAERLDEFREIGFGENVVDITRRLREIRKAGVAVAFGEVTAGSIEISSPVFGAGRAPIASLSLAVAENKKSKAKLTRMSNEVREAAAKLSEKLAQRREARVSK